MIFCVQITKAKNKTDNILTDKLFSSVVVFFSYVFGVFETICSDQQTTKTY